LHSPSFSSVIHQEDLTKHTAALLIIAPPLTRLTPTNTLAMLNIEPPEPKNSGSNADDPINLAHLLGMLHIVDLIC
jgi:hypothetical protein